MSYNIDFSTATSQQIEGVLCKRLEKIRLSRNITQAELAQQSGVSLRTIGRLENGQGISVDTFIRVLIALSVQQNLEALLPDPTVRPVERINAGGSERRRARSGPVEEVPEKWQWSDGGNDDE